MLKSCPGGGDFDGTISGPGSAPGGGGMVTSQIDTCIRKEQPPRSNAPTRDSRLQMNFIPKNANFIMSSP